ncbi:MAG: hypothetical protein QXS57_00110 [Candidatus Caldarchaeum sp.]|uniref:Uncharacterized protein n=1 Tax=Caldiarchaeum subterraneum TaxID=311458 RepID=A0A7J3VTL3_CALS0
MRSSLSVLSITSVMLAVVLMSSGNALTELRFTLVDVFGSSRYRVLLEFPREVFVDEELRLGFTLYLDDLPSLKHYTGYLSLTFTVISEDGRTLARTSINNRAEAYKVDYMFPGYRWGPYTLALKPDYSRLSSGGKMSLYITLEAEEYVEDPLGVPIIPTRPTPSTTQAAVIIVSHRPPIVEVGVAGLAAAVAAVVVFYVLRRKKT